MSRDSHQDADATQADDESSIHNPTRPGILQSDSHMHPARIAELLHPFLDSTQNRSATPDPCHSEPGRRPGEEPASLSPAQLDYISIYINILLRWNAHINLTAIRDPEQIVTRHFGESLFAARHLFPRNARVGTDALVRPAEHGSAAPAAPADFANDRRPTTDDCVADLGSGAGFPGIPIKLWAPHIALTLVESNHKKATFLREVARALTLTDINIQNARAQDLAIDLTKDPQNDKPSSTQTFNVVTLRAVERFDDILPTAALLLRPYGRLALLIGSPQQATAQAALPTISWSEPIPIPQSRSRILLIGTADKALRHHRRQQRARTI